VIGNVQNPMSDRSGRPAQVVVAVLVPIVGPPPLWIRSHPH
jgi:hypothetical protein